MHSDQAKEKNMLAKKAAVNFCKNASEYTAANQGKEWKFFSLRHNEISRTSYFEFLLKKMINL